MSLVIVRSPDGDIQSVDAAAFAQPDDWDAKEGGPWVGAYEGWEVLPSMPVEHMQANAMDEIARIETKGFEQFGQLATAIATIETWSDVKRAERDIETNAVPAEDYARAERYPFLWAISQVANISLANALTVAKPAVIADMTELAFAAARALVARQAVRDAQTATTIANATAKAVG